MSKNKFPRAGFTVGAEDKDPATTAFVKGANVLPPARAIGDEQLATQLNATQQALYPWLAGNARVTQGYTLTLSEPLMLKLDYLREKGKGSKRAVMLAGIEAEVNRLLVEECHVPPEVLKIGAA